jgi:nitrite reductase/ring-hydroxylating ferredoxin subunit
MHEPNRRTFIAGAGAVAVSGCASYGAAPPPAPPPAPAGTPLAKVADIPVGGGTVFPPQLVVVTQPEAGTFHAFSAVCTHQGCTVGDVTGGTINCPCHGSKYAITDGAVTAGPAKRPLDPRQITVAGEDITLA